MQKIIYANIENFKWIKKLSVDNLSRFVAIFGNNWAWKTSFLDAIKNAIKLERWWNSKVRIWEDKWIIEVHFDDFKIKRIIWEWWKLEVEHNGELVSKPQAWLDEIFMWSINDPQKFIQLHNKEKIKYILETQWKISEYDTLESVRSKLFQERADVHKTVLAKEEEVRSQTIEKEKIAIEWIEQTDMTQLQEKLQSINDHNNKLNQLENDNKNNLQLMSSINSSINSLQFRREESNKYIEELKQKILDEESKLKTIDNDISSKTNELEELKKTWDNIQQQIDWFEVIDDSEIKNQLSKYSENQQLLANYNAKADILTKNAEIAIKLRDERKDLDNEVKSIEEKQNKLIEWINLSYKLKLEEWVMYVLQDWTYIALDELNTATQLDIWIDICLSGQNKIKILTIENANALDPNTMEKIKNKIEEKEAQCFLETVYKTWYESITIQNWEIIN